MAGNANSGGARAKPYRDALRLEIAAADLLVKDEALKTLRQIGRRHLDLCLAGDLAAMKELFDRIDGKAHQSADITHDASDGLKELIEYVWRANSSGTAEAAVDGSPLAAEQSLSDH